MNAPLVGLADYKNGTKNNWRRWQWNQIAARVRDRRNAVVLYLASDQDLDRRVAVSKGFNPNNLIAVDIDQSKVDRLRAAGKLAIHGELASVCAYFGGERIDVVAADLCCGITKRGAILMDVISHFVPIKPGGVVAVNLLRGRDAYLNAANAAMVSHYGKSEKHRGKSWIRQVIHNAAWHAQKIGGLRCEDGGAADFFSICSWIYGEYRPSFFSYNSKIKNDRGGFSTQVFDSVVYTQGAAVLFSGSKPERLISVANSIGPSRVNSPEYITPQIAAVLATRTRRINGDLPRCPDF